MLKRWGTIICALLLVAMLTACAKSLPGEEVQKVRTFADPATEKVIKAINDGDYTSFSQDFDQQMRAGLNEPAFRKIYPELKATYGRFISKEFYKAEKKGQYTRILYKAEFSEKSNVIIESVISDVDGKMYISGFWLRSMIDQFFLDIISAIKS